MKKALIIAAALLMVVAVAVAQPVCETISIVLGTATGGTGTVDEVYGWIQEVQVAASDGVSTGLVTVSISPIDGTVADYNIATNTVTDEDIWLPVRDRTDINGAALTSDEPVPYFLAGDTVQFVVTGSDTGITWRCRLKMDD